MASRKRDAQDEFFYAINQHGTVVLTDDALFEGRWEPAGYRRMEDDEQAPIQQHEYDAHQGDVAAIMAARRDEHGHERHPLPLKP